MEKENLKHPARQYFEIDLTTKTAKCLVNSDCDRHVNPLQTVHSGNMFDHLNRRHKKIALEVEANLKNKKTNGKRKPEAEAENDPLLVAKFKKSVIIEACVQLVSVHGRPFSLLEDAAFQVIVSPFCSAIGNSFAINSESIRRLIPITAQRMREKLTSELAGRLVSIKVDSAKRLSRSFVG